MSETGKNEKPVAPTAGLGDRAEVQQTRVAIRDLYPLPGTPEAKALGCTCWVDGTGADGKPVYVMPRGCPIRNHG